MTDGYKIKRGLIRVNGVEKQFYPAEKIYTYDFQNDGALGWTTWSNSGGAYGYESGQGLYQVASSGTWSGANCKMPSAISGTLKKIEIRGYKPSTSAAYGICVNSTDDYSIRCGNYQVANMLFMVGGTQSNVGTTTNGEAKITLEFGDSGVITFAYNSYTGTFTSESLINQIRQALNNGNLYILFSSWNAGSRAYVRKIQFTVS